VSALVLLVAARDLPPGEAWLGPQERAALGRFRAPRRRRDFRLGRLAARRALALLEDGSEDQSRFEVRPDPRGVPLAFRDGAPVAVALSISHSDGWAAAAVQRGVGPLGCDLERIEPRSEAFISDYFTAREQAFVAEATDRDRDLRATLVWSAKEAVMKALGAGLRMPPAGVEVAPCLEPAPDGVWRTFRVSSPTAAAGQRGLWRVQGAFVLTVARTIQEAGLAFLVNGPNTVPCPSEPSMPHR
jgi:4'-phosphopantetheinyl transferase